MRSDRDFMLHALRLAVRHVGLTAPNPSVGALVVKDGLILGAGVTECGGRPHAETQALAQAGEHARGATLYVTLEPCAHYGKTPPCAVAVVQAGIARVVSACADPNPLVGGKGYAILREAGMEVTENICFDEGRRANEGFFSRIERGRPFVTLKVATSLDGKIAAGNGESQWITGPQARARVHDLRAQHDVLLTGIGTVLQDDPEMTCRVPGRLDDSPRRVVMDGNLRLPADARLLPALVVTTAQTLARETDKATLLRAGGAEIVTVKNDAARLSLPDTLRLLAERGATRLLVEAGSAIASECMRQNLVDRLYWFRAPFVIGDKGLPALLGEDGPLDRLPRFRREQCEQIGDDMLEIYDCRRAA